MALQPPDPLHRLLDDALAETPPGRSVWVALSGGVDSVLLVTLAAKRCRVAGRRLCAVHINHGLQAAASTFEAHCQAVCQALGVTLVIERVNVAPRGEGIEGAARRARYAGFQRVIPPGDTLWLAQHQDDQAETLLLAALRGSGVRGLAGMPYRREWQGLLLLRPWLGAGRQALVDAARAIGLEWCEDPSNQDEALDRNRLRHRVLPALASRWPGAARSLSQSAAHAGEADALLAEYAAEELARLCMAPGCLPAAAMRERSRPRQRLLVRTLCQRSELATPPRKRLETLLDQLNASRDASVMVRWEGCVARVWRDRLYIAPDMPALPEWQADWQGLPGVATPLGALALALEWPRDMTLRFRQGGEVLHLAGRGRRDLKRLLQESDIPPWERARVIVVMDGDVCLAALKPPATVLWQATGVVLSQATA